MPPSVTVTGSGDGTLANVVSSDHPRGECTGECETEHVYGWYSFAKDAVPAPGTELAVGDEVTYTLTVTQSGPGVVTGASITDDLSAVLDDATLTGSASASAGSVTVVDGVLSWTGDLPVDGVVTITYSVTVTGDGDGTLANAVTSDDPRAECDDVCETEHPVPPTPQPPAPPTGVDLPRTGVDAGALAGAALVLLLLGALLARGRATGGGVLRR